MMHVGENLNDLGCGNNSDIVHRQPRTAELGRKHETPKMRTIFAAFCCFSSSCGYRTTNLVLKPLESLDAVVLYMINISDDGRCQLQGYEFFDTCPNYIGGCHRKKQGERRRISPSSVSDVFFQIFSVSLPHIMLKQNGFSFSKIIEVIFDTVHSKKNHFQF